MSASTDRIGAVAEVYRVAALRHLGHTARGYKRAKNAGTLRQLVDALRATAPGRRG